MNCSSCCDVLILTASYGAGHNHVAQSIYRALSEYSPGLNIKIMDFFAFATPIVNKLTEVGYVQMVRHFPKGYHWFYEFTRSIEPDSQLQGLLNNLGRQRLLQYLEELQPKAIVCTFPTPAGVLSALKTKGKDIPPVITVITDVAVHSQWVHATTDAYIVADSSLVPELQLYGIPAAKVFPLGIPLRKSFSTAPKLSKSEICSSYRLREDLFTVLVMGGAFGMLGGVSNICSAIANIPENLQIAAVCGHNRPLYRKLYRIKDSVLNPIQIFGYVENISDLMSAADLLVSKAGGITVFEALSKGLPFFVYKPIPGQEEKNTRFMEAIGAGKAFNSVTRLTQAAAGLKNNPQTLAAMKNNALAYAKPNASEDAAELIISMAKLPHRKDKPAKDLFRATC